MDEVQDYTIRNGLGIRIINGRACQVIRKQKGEWIHIGREYSLPVEENMLVWTREGIPASVLAVALRVYELDHPGSRLRDILSRRIPRPPIATTTELIARTQP
jgi:hypothetical protein